jgi:hypothetical protein
MHLAQRPLNAVNGPAIRSAFALQLPPCSLEVCSRQVDPLAIDERGECAWLRIAVLLCKKRLTGKEYKSALGIL